jgi:hypothetical protein
VKVAVRSARLDQAPAYPCARHPAFSAETSCDHCGRFWCRTCTERPPVRGVVLHVCPECEGRSHLSPVERPERVGDFARMLPTVWKYPFRAQGWMALLAGAIFYGLIAFAIRHGGMMAPGAVLVLGPFLFTYLWMFYLSIASTSADGSDEMPDWPDPVQYTDQRIAPLFRLLAALILCFAPAAAGWFVFQVNALEFVGLVALGTLYLPIQILALALGGTLRSLNPFVLVPAAVRAGPAYLVACGALMAVLGARALSGSLLDHVPVIGGFVGGLIGSYFLALAMRIIGLLYRTHQRRMQL